jgi:hypothetical protein
MGPAIEVSITGPNLNTNVGTVYPNSNDLSTTISFSYFKNKSDIIPKEVTISLAEFRKLVITPKLCKDKNSAPLLSPAIYKPEDQRIENVDTNGNPTGIKGRQNANVQSWGLLPLDYDHQKEHPREFLQPLIDAGLMFDAVPTASNRRVCTKNPDGTEYFYRVFLYINKAIPADKQPTVWSAIRALTGNRIDEQAKALEQMFFIPFITSADERLEIRANEGELLEWESLKLEEQEESLNNLNTHPNTLAASKQVNQAKQIDHPMFKINSVDKGLLEFCNRLRAEGYVPQIKDGEQTIELSCTCNPSLHKKGSQTSLLIKFGNNGVVRITCLAQLGAGINDIESILATRNIIIEPAEKETNLNNLNGAKVGAFTMIDGDKKEKGKPKRFLFNGRVVCGFLNGLYGEDKLKKSQIGLAMAAALSVGEDLFGEKDQQQGHTLIFSSEDDEDTIFDERLPQFKHDHKYISVFARRFPLNEDSNLLKLKATILEKSATLVIIDAIDDFIGEGVRSNSTTSVRGQILAVLNDIAKDTGCAILIIGHTTKDTKNTNARARIMNSAAFKSACRSVLFVARNPTNYLSEGVFVHMDGNYKRLAESRTFLLGDVPFEWTGISDLTAENVLCAVDEDADYVIRTTLKNSDYIIGSSELERAVKPLGVTPDMLKKHRSNAKDIVAVQVKTALGSKWFTVLLKEGKSGKNAARQLVIEKLSAEIK